MLHELLLALSGHSGSIFSRNENGQIQVVADLPFIHPTEAALLNRICLLATHYSKFTSFIQQYGNSPGIGGAAVKLKGLYLRAFCEGLSSVLEPYRSALLELEQGLLADPHLTAAHVQSSLEEYQQLFPALGELINQVENQKVHGCHLLEVLHRASESGIPIVNNAILRILHACHVVLYKQLAAWMLHGILMDHYSEFFITGVEKAASVAPSSVEEEDIGLGGITGSQLQKMLMLTELSPPGSHAVFALHAEMLPSYIPARVAERILFVGESVQTFEGKQQGKQSKHRGSILQQHADIFAKELQELSQQATFSLRQFEEVIDKIRLFVAEQLWRLVVVESDLVSHLRTMKEVFLLGRGELFLAFIDQADKLLKGPPNGTTQHYANLALQQAARNVLLDDDHVLNKVTLVVTLPNTHHPEGKGLASDDSTVKSETGWSMLSLNYNVDWPLHILLTQSVLERYKTIFKFLLFVKRIQLKLQQCWALQMQRRHMQDVRGDSNRWWLRNHMSFLIDNLQYYLQVDVIESQFSILLEKVETTHDFEAIRFAHDQFLTALLSQAFLLMKPIAHCLNEILELCHAFCLLLSHAELELSDMETHKLETITKSFQRQSALLFKILSSVRTHQSGPHLAQLLLRIDFNKYFTSAGGQLGRCRADPDLDLDIALSANAFVPSP